MARRRALGGNVLDEVAGLGRKAPAKAPAPKKAPPAEKASEKTRQSYYMEPENLETIRTLAWWTRVTVSDVVNQAVREYGERQAKKGGDFAPVDKVRRGRPVTRRSA